MLDVIRLFILMIVFAVAGRVAGREIPPFKLPEGTVKVVAVVYDYEADELSRAAVVMDGKPHRGIIRKFNKVLPEAEVAALADALTEKHARRNRFLCDFAPHHGFIFYDKADAIVGSVSVCFSCADIKSPNFQGEKDLFYSYWDWQALRGILERNGVPIFRHAARYTELWKEQG